MKNQIFEMTSKMYQEEKEKCYHYSALNALYRAIAQKHSYTCSPVADKVRVEFSEGGHDYMVDATVEEFLKCINEGYESRKRYYQIYNEELWYLDTDVFQTFEEAKLATSNKCRSYGVYEFYADNDELAKIYTSADLLEMMIN